MACNTALLNLAQKQVRTWAKRRRTQTTSRVVLFLLWRCSKERTSPCARRDILPGLSKKNASMVVSAFPLFPDVNIEDTVLSGGYLTKKPSFCVWHATYLLLLCSCTDLNRAPDLILLRHVGSTNFFDF
jgi:hypothetical protein